MIGAMPVTRMVPARPITNAPHQLVSFWRPPPATSPVSRSDWLPTWFLPPKGSRTRWWRYGTNTKVSCQDLWDEILADRFSRFRPSRRRGRTKRLHRVTLGGQAPGMQSTLHVADGGLHPCRGSGRERGRCGAGGTRRAPAPELPRSRYGCGMWEFRSDTFTRPSEAMRRAMASAEVGDD